MSVPILHAKNLSKSVKNISVFEKRYRKTLWQIPELTIREPGFYLLAGKNGCGKSTLLRCLLSLIKFDKGEVSWYGKTTINSSVIGYLPEFPVIPPCAKVHHWLSWMLDMPVDKLEGTEHSLSRFATLSIKHLFDTPANRLSKGQLQRVQLWAALSHNPKVVVFDEPFSGLDPWARVELAELIDSILKNGTTVLMSTHELPSLLHQRATATWLLQNESLLVEPGFALPA